VNDDDNPETTPLAGTGLGISQKIAMKMDTVIEFSSTVDIGSTFWFKVKVEETYGSILNIKKESSNNLVDEDMSVCDNSKSTKAFVVKRPQMEVIQMKKRSSPRCHLEESKLMNIRIGNTKSKIDGLNIVPPCKLIFCHSKFR
jgi:hypothetical protein